MPLLKIVPDALSSMLRISDDGSKPRWSWFVDDMINQSYNIREICSWSETGRPNSWYVLSETYIIFTLIHSLPEAH